jgi:hypothetical protein
MSTLISRFEEVPRLLTELGGLESLNIHFSSSSPSLRGSVTFVDDCLDRPGLQGHGWDLLACRHLDLDDSMSNKFADVVSSWLPRRLDVG